MTETMADFLLEWQYDSLRLKPFVEKVYASLQQLPGVTLEFKARPGISYSLRAKHTVQQKRPLFVLVDIIDDEPEARWLSLCFYNSFVTDPEERGDQVPGGLLGEDACCFDIDAPDTDSFYYLSRIAEAYARAKEGE